MATLGPNSFLQQETLKSQTLPHQASSSSFMRRERLPYHEQPSSPSSSPQATTFTDGRHSPTPLPPSVQARRNLMLLLALPFYR